MKGLKVTIPNELKADMPLTTWGKILSATPVVMAVVSTMLAGLASSEMTRAQYSRSLAAQQQSKAGDQWNFFQAKRLRGAIQRNTVDLLQNTGEVPVFEAASFQKMTAASPMLSSASGQQALALLEKSQLPPIPPAPVVDPSIKASLDAVENLKSDDEVAALLALVSEKSLEDAIKGAREQAQAFDVVTKPVNQTIDSLDSLVSQDASGRKGNSAGSEGLAAEGGALLSRAFTAARLRYAAQRYEVEARLNQGIANFYELQVRKSNLKAQRHHMRSQRFFFGMLGAQTGVIIATFAMAARNRNLLWSLAAGAGLLAIAFAIYVYLYV